jgi:NAD(P)-dependent dehydrogenase (short-subunit alcohol dehydrogenase family)
MKLLENKVAVIYGGGGAIGGAAARVFAGEGARVFVAGRTRDKLERVVRDIVAAGGVAEAAVLDALDESAVERHAAEVAEKAGGIDVELNAVGLPHVQGTPFVELSLADFLQPITENSRTNFITAKAVSRHMLKRKKGVILTLCPPGGRLVGEGYIGHGAGCAAVEAFTRLLAYELGPSGIRVLCVSPHAIPEALLGESHGHGVFEAIAEKVGVTPAQMLEGAAAGTPLRRLPTLSEVAKTMAFVASDHVGPMTGTVVNLSSGAVMG